MRVVTTAYRPCDRYIVLYCSSVVPCNWYLTVLTYPHVHLALPFCTCIVASNASERIRKHPHLTLLIAASKTGKTGKTCPSLILLLLPRPVNIWAQFHFQAN